MTYKLHLMLDGEQLVLRVGARNSTIWQTRDELVTRDKVHVVLGQLVGKGTLNIRSGDRQDGPSTVAARLLGGNDGDLAVVLTTMTRMSVARQLRRVQRRISTSKGA